ncbi:uncharacterized protein UV8b_05817 [Ustilaginoidea virens]|uniref:Rhodopsin domain-containing protein n=1 Tax=Ustilaginoidea virens TaxID=1159556 RepID=A0A8E5HTX9_USTVR|nr:uncharacterized protein UV8b_05817 [Ustilaginoidea virens]QUC21574.1 hypothetical protein UV8b_05817 [Ustilaginoidea virens]
MATSVLTPAQRALYGQDRRHQLFVTLVSLFTVNNLVVGGRLWANWKAHYRHHRSPRRVFAEDYFIFLSALCINAVIGNLIAATYYGLGLHSWRINAEDADFPSNLSHTFKHVWITMLLTGPTFTLIKLTLLFFYRRLFLVNHGWLWIAWWANLVYVLLWLVGATGFYLFQCWPPQWYFLQYYQRYNRPPPYPLAGQCNATTVRNVSIPLIFGLLSDVMILVLPVATICRLNMTTRHKLGLSLVFSVGLVACALDLVRIVELNIDTDDKVDPSYGVVIFLILSAATEVAAVVCACMPVIGPQAWKYYKRNRASYGGFGRKRFSRGGGPGGPAARFKQPSGSAEDETREATIGLSRIQVQASGTAEAQPALVDDGAIWVHNEFKITVDESDAATAVAAE